MALPIYLQSAVDTAKNGIFWAGVMCVAAISAKAVFEIWIKKKSDELKTRRKLENPIDFDNETKYKPPGAAPKGYEWQLVRIKEKDFRNTMPDMKAD